MTMFPLKSICEVFLSWEEDTPRYITEVQYREYVTQTIHLSGTPFDAHLARCIARITDYYTIHGIKLLLKHIPVLKAHLDREHDRGLITEVCSSIYQPHNPSLITYISHLRCPSVCQRQKSCKAKTGGGKCKSNLNHLPQSITLTNQSY